METIVAREKEVKELEGVLKSESAEFLAVYGRRRIGKTFLIHKFFQDKGLYFEFTGIKDASLSTQLKNFAIAFSDLFLKGQVMPTPKTWVDAFTALRRQIERFKEKRPIILFFDELSWISTPRSGFLQALEHFWNRYVSRDRRVILVVCGSAAAWMIRNILDARGGLHGRVTRVMRLMPFTLSETERFLQFRKLELDRKQIVEIYMAMGGVAHYLTQIRRGHSSSQIIQEVCFSESGLLSREFYRLYSSLFDNYEHHVAVVKALARHSNGLSRDKLLEELGVQSGGSASKILNELEESGFILSVPSYGKRKVGWLFRLIDPFSLFYLKWIEKADLKIGHLEKNYWEKKQRSQEWAAWAGYAFENVCLMHVDQIKWALGLSAVTSTQSQWSYRSNNKQGAQIDLIIDRADQCINLCELKFYKSIFSINKGYAQTLENKKNSFQEQTQTKKTLFTTLIASFGVKHNPHYLQVVDQDLDLNALYHPL